jgi:hypothetical protein
VGPERSEGVGSYSAKRPSTGTILEMNVESYRSRAATGRAATMPDGATTTIADSLADNSREDPRTGAAGAWLAERRL